MVSTTNVFSWALKSEIFIATGYALTNLQVEIGAPVWLRRLIFTILGVKVNNSKQNRKRKPIKINENKIQNVVDEFVYDVKEEQDTCRSFNDRPNSPESDKMLSVDDDDDDDGNI